MEKGKVLSSSSEESSSDRQGATSHVCACVRACVEDSGQDWAKGGRSVIGFELQRGGMKGGRP